MRKPMVKCAGKKPEGFLSYSSLPGCTGLGLNSLPSEQVLLFACWVGELFCLNDECFDHRQSAEHPPRLAASQFGRRTIAGCTGFKVSPDLQWCPFLFFECAPLLSQPTTPPRRKSRSRTQTRWRLAVFGYCSVCCPLIVGSNTPGPQHPLFWFPPNRTQLGKDLPWFPPHQGLVVLF